MFDWNTKAWIASWKWVSGHSPTELANRVEEYTMPDHIRDAYEEELAPPKALIPLMAVVQEHKQKIQPVLDYQKLNGFVEAFTANAEMCS